MRLAAAELVDSREILPGQWLQSYHAPDLAVGSRAGQFVHVRTGDFSGLVLRRPFSTEVTRVFTCSSSEVIASFIACMGSSGAGDITSSMRS